MLSARRVKMDIIALAKIAGPARRLVNKTVAHSTRDRRKIGRPTFKDLDDAIDALENKYQLYSLLINGNYRNPLTFEANYCVQDDLKKIWPPMP